MAIYIAVCDDNIADRKQTERLLEREKDERLKNDGDVLYIESFGSSQALMTTPVKYDIFLIDISSSSENGMVIAKSLRAMGIIAPIVLLSSAIDYKSYGNNPADIIHIEKPVIKGQISHLVDVAKDWSINKPHLLEIRGKKKTVFLPHRDLVRAVDKGNSVEVVTASGEYIEIAATMTSFLDVVRGYQCFTMCKKAMINIHHVQSISQNTLHLDNGEQFEFSTFKLREILEDFVRYTAAHN